jgi:hypothetical protein
MIGEKTVLVAASGKRYRQVDAGGIEGAGVFYCDEPLIKYYGCYARDRMEGPGILEFPDGDKYLGEYSGGNREGHGVYESIQCVYSGEFLCNQRHGMGVELWRDGTIYYGGVSGKTRDGYGVVHLPSGAIYYGEHRNGHPDGKAVQETNSGERTFDEVEAGMVISRTPFDANNQLHGQVLGAALQAKVRSAAVPWPASAQTFGRRTVHSDGWMVWRVGEGSRGEGLCFARQGPPS